VRVDRRAIDAIVLDIEGTTTSIAFVYEVLFPFARRHLRGFLREHRTSPALADLIVQLELEWADDVARGEAPPPWNPGSGTGGLPDADVSLVAAYVEWLMDRDRKSPALKRLQGLIWERGYQSGELTSDLFADVRPALERWRAAQIPVAIYSSGSALAQRLLFGHTRDGDLTSHFSAFFDTGVGPKTSPESYRRIAAVLGVPPERLLFMSDAAKEIDAARAAGCQTAMVVRPGNPVQALHSPIDVVRSFDEIVVS